MLEFGTKINALLILAIIMYEYIEDLYFPYFIECIRCDYNGNYDSVLKVAHRLRCLKLIETTQTVLRRFIIRGLPVEPQQNQELGSYMSREDIWPVPVDEELQKRVLNALIDVPIEAALQLYEAIS